MNDLISAAVNTRLLLELAELDDPDTDFELTSNYICECYERKDRLPNLLPIYRKLRGELFWRAFHATWAWCYDTWPYRRPLLALFTRHQHCSWARGDDDGEPLTIYRGCSRRRIRGVSWTTEAKIAEQFAAGYDGLKVPNPVVATAQIDRKNVFAYDHGQDEYEVIVDPMSLRLLGVQEC